MAKALELKSSIIISKKTCRLATCLTIIYAWQKIKK